jgi:hypothetical protein
MHAVVVGRRGGDAEAVCEPVARLLGRALVEVRGRLAQVGGDPLVVAATRERAPVREAADVLAAHGFEASLLDVRTPFVAHPMARAFELRDDAIAIVAGDGTHATIAWRDVDAIVAGARPRPEPHRPLVPVRNVLTAADGFVQPLMVREEVVASPGDELLVYLVARDRAIVLAEDRLDYRSLGAAVQPSRGANFRRVAQLVREHCPAAPYDHRLERQSTRVHILGPITALDHSLELAAAIVADDIRCSAPDPYR